MTSVSQSVCPDCGHLSPVGGGVWLICRDCGRRWFTGQITTANGTTTLDREAAA